jgi:hypothetical protein
MISPVASIAAEIFFFRAEFRTERLLPPASCELTQHYHFPSLAKRRRVIVAAVTGGAEYQRRLYGTAVDSNCSKICGRAPASKARRTFSALRLFHPGVIVGALTKTAHGAASRRLS